MLQRFLFLLLLAFFFNASAALACLDPLTNAEVNELKKLAVNGDVEAMVQLGDAYNFGYYESEKKDFKEAVKWWQRAVDKGNTKAMVRLAENYEEGKGVKRNQKQANKLYRMAADQGDEIGQHHMWAMYEFGRFGEAKDPFKAYMWYMISDRTSRGIRRNPEDARKQASFSQLTPEQAAEAEKLAQEWMPQPRKTVQPHKILKTATKSAPPKAAETAPTGGCND
jgi:Sel1 repeat